MVLFHCFGFKQLVKVHTPPLYTYPTLPITIMSMYTMNDLLKLYDFWKGHLIIFGVSDICKLSAMVDILSALEVNKLHITTEGRGKYSLENVLIIITPW